MSATGTMVGLRAAFTVHGSRFTVGRGQRPRLQRAIRAALRPEAGFTLLELLIAMSIGAVVLLVIQTTYFGALRLHNTTHERLDEQAAIANAVDVVRRDLAGVVLPNGALCGQFQTETFSSISTDGYGDRASPDLYTNSGTIDAWNPFSEVQMVSYFVGTPSDGTGRTVPGESLSANSKALLRIVTRNLLPVQDPAPEEQVLLQGVESASMSFYDGTGWVDTWDSTETSTLPTAVKFSLVMAPVGDGQRSQDPIELVVPIAVRTVAGQQQDDNPQEATP